MINESEPTRKGTKLDWVLDELQAAIVQRGDERSKAKPKSREFYHADGAKDGLLEAQNIVENIKSSSLKRRRNA